MRFCKGCNAFFGRWKDSVDHLSECPLCGLFMEEVGDVVIAGNVDFSHCVVKPSESKVDHPSHYGGKDNPYEAIKVIDALGLSFCLGNAFKYIARAGKKTESPIEDLEKAAWYINHEIERLKK